MIGGVAIIRCRGSIHESGYLFLETGFGTAAELYEQAAGATPRSLFLVSQFWTLELNLARRWRSAPIARPLVHLAALLGGRLASDFPMGELPVRPLLRVALAK